MPVSPSFQNFPVVSDIFYKSGKSYLKVQNPKTGTIREVRWYSDSEYAKSYGNKLVNSDCRIKNLKRISGFEHGPILVIRRNRPQDEDWLRASDARYRVGIGWFFDSSCIFPDNAPNHFKYVLMGWEEFHGKDEEHVKEPSQLAEILDKRVQNKEWFNING